jgi:hypothetical protein
VYLYICGRDQVESRLPAQTAIMGLTDIHFNGSNMTSANVLQGSTLPCQCQIVADVGLYVAQCTTARCSLRFTGIVVVVVVVVFVVIVMNIIVIIVVVYR